jgi:RNA polymerase sigma-70 factor, ECF subfamily
MKKSAANITQLLTEYRKGDQRALDALLPQVYEQLHRLAAGYMRKENAGHTLQPTALVNEAFMKLVKGADVDWRNRSHFFAVAANIMRHILVDHAKAKRAAKRGGGGIVVAFDEKFHTGPKEDDNTPDLIALDAALKRLAEIDERQAKVVELRYFGGMSVEETAEALTTSPATVKRDWAAAKLWLYRELKKQDEHKAAG